MIAMGVALIVMAEAAKIFAGMEWEDLGKAGAANAAILATQILAVSDAKLAEKMVEYKKSMAAKIMEDTYIETYEGE